MDWHDLQKMKLNDLRELAKEKTTLEGLSGLHKPESWSTLRDTIRSTAIRRR